MKEFYTRLPNSISNDLVKWVDKNKKEREWQERLEFLHSDLATWQRNLQAANGNNNPNLVENINKIITQCKKSLDEHMLQKPALIASSEAD